MHEKPGSQIRSSRVGCQEQNKDKRCHLEFKPFSAYVDMCILSVPLETHSHSNFFTVLNFPALLIYNAHEQRGTTLHAHVFPDCVIVYPTLISFTCP